MKKNILNIFLFALFAIPVPVAVCGSMLSLLWLVSAIAFKYSPIEIICAIFGIAIGSTYLWTYIYSIKETSRQQKKTYKTYLPALHCLVALIYLLTLNPIWKYIDNSREYFGFTKKDFSVVDEHDTHGGFNGDGSYYLILDCSSNKNKAAEIIKGWKKLPLSENLELIMYSGERDGITYGYNLSEEAKIPEVKNGYYIFKDRSSESTDSADDTQLFERASFNFSLAIYDSDTDKLYYFAFDT